MSAFFQNGFSAAQRVVCPGTWKATAAWKLASQSVNVASAKRQKASADNGNVAAIEFAEVELVSGDDVKLLFQAEAEGIELKSCPAYIREWIANERESSHRLE